MRKGLNLLVLEATSWARNCTARLRQRGHLAEPASGWKEARQLLRTSYYDLLLVDEPVWTADPESARQLIQSGAKVAVLATSFTREGHRFFAEAGAKGYLDKSLGPDSLLLEIEKVLAVAGLVQTRGRVLMVDNDPQVRSALKSRLTLEGWEVMLAENPEEAMEKIRSDRPHVVVLDIRLRDDKDELDLSGFELARRIRDEHGPVIKLVGLTGSPTRNTARHTAGILDAFVLKEDSDDLPQEIERVHDQLGINSTLEVEYEYPIDLPALVGMIRIYQDLPDGEQKKIAQEVEEILRKLFPHVLKVIVYHLSPRRGGSGIALVRPFVANRLGRPLVVKFGPRPRMRAEVKRYRDHVQPVLEDPLTFLDGQQPAETLNLGGLKFDLAGMTDEKPRTFNDFYRDRGTGDGDITAALEHLFKVTCKGWYDNREDWSFAGPGDLLEAYATHILERQSQRSAVLEVVNRLLQETWVPQISFAAARQDLMVSLQGRELVLPDPRGLLEPAGAAEFLPLPVSQCRTHGNLHGLNMLLDRNHKVWLIDFYLAGWGPILLDFVQLECAIKFELVEQNDLGALYELEKALLRPSESREMLQPGQHPLSDDLRKAFATISTLRRLAHELVEPDLREYYLGVLLQGLRTAEWVSRDPKEKNRQAVRQSHALLSAALAAYRLRNWGERWRGWPDERSAITPG